VAEKEGINVNMQPNSAHAESQCYTCTAATPLLCRYIDSRDPAGALDAMGARYKALHGRGIRNTPVVHYRVQECPQYAFGPLPMIAAGKRVMALVKPGPVKRTKGSSYQDIPNLTREGYLEFKRRGMTDREMLEEMGLKYHTWKASLVLAKRQWKLSYYKYKPELAVPTEQRCTACGEVKPISEFVKHPKSPNGHTYHCRSCKTKYLRGWRTIRDVPKTHQDGVGRAQGV